MSQRYECRLGSDVYEFTEPTDEDAKRAVEEKILPNAATSVFVPILTRLDSHQVEIPLPNMRRQRRRKSA